MPAPKILAALLTLCLLSGVGQADPTTDLIHKQAEANATALQQGDFETIVRLTYPKVVEMLGGKEKMISVIQAGMEGMQSRGMKITSITTGEPGPVTVSGDKMYSIVPTSMVITAPDAKMSQNSYLLAVSSDKGATWQFLDGTGINPGSIKLVLPDFPADFKLPEKEQPKVEPIAPKTP